jgi:hypothetical protein
MPFSKEISAHLSVVFIHTSLTSRGNVSSQVTEGRLVVEGKLATASYNLKTPY